jgi:cytochrome c oxidase subunit 4
MTREISVPTYVIVCTLLVLLTLGTVTISFAPLPGVWHIAVGLIIGSVKASLVVLFFMHALLSPRLTWLVILVSCFWMGILLVLTYSDYFTRGALPFMPGH